MNQARKEIHCEECWREGYTGRGIGVAVLDTGIFLHEDFGGYSLRQRINFSLSLSM